MRKISTLFKKDSNDLGLVINEVNPENEWVIQGYGLATRKYDGTAAMILDGEIYKRYDVKKGKSVPDKAIPCQEADLITGHWPHWVKCDRGNPADKYFFEAFDKQKPLRNHTYELVGPKIQGNPEKVSENMLIIHGHHLLDIIQGLITFDFLKEYLSDPKNDIEGVVFHHETDNRMCKIRKSDFGIKR